MVYIDYEKYKFIEIYKIQAKRLDVEYNERRKSSSAEC